jgi:hypothetical protein
MSTPLEVAEAALKKVHDAEVAAGVEFIKPVAPVTEKPASAEIPLGPTDVKKD